MLKKLSVGMLALFFALLLLPFTGTAAADTLPTNLVANPSMETAATATEPTDWFPSNWGVNTPSLTYETDGHTGSRSVKVALSSYTDGDANWYFTDAPVTAGKNYAYSNWYKSDVDTEIDAQVTTTTGTVEYYYVASVPASPTAWAQVNTQFTAPANAKSVTFFQALAKVGYVQVDDASLTLFTPSPLNRAMVSLTFDDGWRNQYTTGLPLLDHYGFKATFYLLTSTLDFPDYMDTTMFQGLYADGQEIASHTVTHPHLPTLTVAQVDQELADSRTALQNMLGLTVAKNFATPFGEYNTTVVTEIKKYYRSHRSTDEGYNTKDTFDIYNIKVQNILDTTSPAQVAEWVAQAQADKTWLVLVYHLVQADPTTSDEDYSVTPANLDAELAAIQQSGIAVVTVDQAIDEVLAQLNPTTPPVLKPGDVNGDTFIDIYDLSTLSTNWQLLTGATRAQGDLNADGAVDIYDLSILSTNWGK